MRLVFELRTCVRVYVFHIMLFDQVTLEVWVKTFKISSTNFCFNISPGNNISKLKNAYIFRPLSESKQLMCLLGTTNTKKSYICIWKCKMCFGKEKKTCKGLICLFNLTCRTSSKLDRTFGNLVCKTKE